VTYSIRNQLENIEAIEKRLWNSADTLRANSNYASNEYFLPVMGLIFLRHAYSRFLGVKDEIQAGLSIRGGVTRPVTKEDFSRKSAIFLQPKAQFDYLVSLGDQDDRARAIIDAMSSIEADYDNLRGVLPKDEYQTLDNHILGQLLRNLNPEELKKMSGDVFGRIYEYFLTQFADLKAHDNGEFFTPVSLVSLIANVLEPEKGIVLDPACGSGGMFVQSAHFVELLKANPMERLIFYGMEKNQTTIRLAKMNLAVHGLEGDIQRAITYYEDPHNLRAKADFVLSNPPFNVNEVDADKVKRDPRLPFGLPGVNKGGKVSNGNYLWISYFYSYLSERGRAGFVMSSQASSAGRDEAKVRQKIIESGDVDIMIAIGTNFFYTRAVPCELWFLDRGKPEALWDKVLMIDARNIYRKVTRKINDFSPEQLQNILSIAWLCRGQSDRFLKLVGSHLENTLIEAKACFEKKVSEEKIIHPLPDFALNLTAFLGTLQSYLDPLPKEGSHAEILQQLKDGLKTFNEDIESFRATHQKESTAWIGQKYRNGELKATSERLVILAENSNDLVKQADLLYKLAIRLIDICEGGLAAKESPLWASREIVKVRKATDETRQITVEQLKKVRYFHRQAVWLVERFPDAVLRNVEGLVKLVDRAEIAANDWSLTPGRYVGVAAEEEEEGFDFEEALRNIHVELEGLNTEAVELATKIKKNFEELEI